MANSGGQDQDLDVPERARTLLDVLRSEVDSPVTAVEAHAIVVDDNGGPPDVSDRTVRNYLADFTEAGAAVR